MLLSVTHLFLVLVKPKQSTHSSADFRSSSAAVTATQLYPQWSKPAPLMEVFPPRIVRTVGSIQCPSFPHSPLLWHLPHSHGFKRSPEPCHLLVLVTSLSLLVTCSVTTSAKVWQFIPLGSLNILQNYFVQKRSVLAHLLSSS